MDWKYFLFNFLTNLSHKNISIYMIEIESLEIFLILLANVNISIPFFGVV